MRLSDTARDFNTARTKHRIEGSINILTAHEEDATALRRVLVIIDAIVVHLDNPNTTGEDGIKLISVLTKLALIASLKGPYLQNQLAAEYLAGHQDEISLLTPQTDYSLCGILTSFMSVIGKLAFTTLDKDDSYIYRPHYNPEDDGLC